MRVLLLAQELPHPVVESGNVLLRMRKKIAQVHLIAGHALQMAEDHLQGALKELDLPLDEEEVAGLEGAGERLGGVPEPSADDAGAVAQL